MKGQTTNDYGFENVKPFFNTIRKMVQNYLFGGVDSELSPDEMLFGYTDSNVLHLSEESNYLNSSLSGFLDPFITPILPENLNRNTIQYETGEGVTGKIKSINGRPYLNKKDQYSDGEDQHTISVSATSNFTFITDNL
jgi:hypothetical protein